MKVCCYTVLTNDHDYPHAPTVITPGVDYILFTDDEAVKIKGYKQVVIPKGDVKEQRAIKIYPFDILPGYDIYIYHDSSYSVSRNFTQLLNVFQGGFGVKRHSKRTCVYEEAKKCIELGKSDFELTQKQSDYNKHIEVPVNFGVQETGLLVRDTSFEAKELCKMWLLELRAEWATHRDQLSLPAAILRTGIEPKYIANHFLNAFFTQHKHKPKITGNKRIWYLQPFSPDLNIGAEYNEQISRIPPDDYVCILDHDVMFLHPKTKLQIQEIVNSNTQYAILGCMLSRIGSARQCPGGKSSDDPNLLNHIPIAEQLHNTQYGVVTPYAYPIAGAFMLFPRSTWDRVKFTENSITFDTEFCREVMKWGKIGLMQGVYVKHLYRLQHPNPRHYKEHLRTQ